VPCTLTETAPQIRANLLHSASFTEHGVFNVLYSMNSHLKLLETVRREQHSLRITFWQPEAMSARCSQSQTAVIEVNSSADSLFCGYHYNQELQKNLDNHGRKRVNKLKKMVYGHMLVINRCSNWTRVQSDAWPATNKANQTKYNNVD